MSLLEDRILRIIELRRSGKTESEIALELGIEPAMVSEYEQTVRNAIAYAGKEGHHTVASIGKHAGISAMVVELYARQYNIELPSQTSAQRVSYGGRIDSIRQCVQEGKHAAEEIGKIIGLSPTTVYQYAQNLIKNI